MRIIKRILLFAIGSIFLLHTIQYNAYAQTNSNIQAPVRVAVFLYDLNELFLSNVKQDLENIQKENANKVEFTFFDSNGNQSTEDDNVSTALTDDFDLFVVQPVNPSLDVFRNTLNMISPQNIPLIIFAPPSTQLASLARTYPRSVIIGGDDEQSGILQGKILADAWKANKSTIDHNKDNILQYVMIKGPANDPATLARSKYSIQELNEEHVNTQELSSTFCNWDRTCARDAIDAILLRHDDKTEAIIANSDDMAIGVIEALQKYGFNKNDPSKYIPVVGIGGLPNTQELVKQGVMLGTVIQNPIDYANAVYAVGMNLVSGKLPLSGTNYKFDETGNTIRIPYYPYTK
ncbi:MULTISPECIES: galactose ABC transporter substrate-binding protein [unclassified Clostridium]|uniref:galactose ABC transporter substrate-binding protein n=1 Tax=unclassified Clostridium TaxID=2614128 RepID=UPI0002983FEC|nr:MULTISPECIES: galactose ABC transporter substrate-binding protein [unclassified Clostridium]EKQ58005.1 MAG: ABC-type sugar transport system, periplasmic component [Clostridium sp. Maddingley MBC34-26]